MRLLSVLLIFAVAGYLAWKFLIPSLISSQKAMKGVRKTIGVHERLISLLPPATVHATVGLVYLSEDIEETLSGGVLGMDVFSPMEGVLVYEPDKFSILDIQGRELFASTPAQVVLGVPENFDLMDLDSKYFFLLIEGQYGLVALDHRPVGEPSGSRIFAPNSGDRQLGYWDHYIA